MLIFNGAMEPTKAMRGVAVQQCLNKLGRTGPLVHYALLIHMLTWYRDRGITLVADHVVGVENTLSDTLSCRTLANTQQECGPSPIQLLQHSPIRSVGQNSSVLHLEVGGECPSHRCNDLAVAGPSGVFLSTSSPTTEDSSIVNL